MTPAKTILFVSHDASRTGATIVLLKVLEWLRARTDFAFQILLNHGGPLEPEFREIAPVSVFHQYCAPSENRGIRLFRRARLLPDPQKDHLRRLKQCLMNAQVDLIYVNTIANIEPVIWLTDLNCPILCHVHELEYAIRYCVGVAQFETLKSLIHQYIAVSESVKRNLVVHHQIPEEKIQVVYECLAHDFFAEADTRQMRASVCDELRIPPEARIVCASGTIDWRKGADLFIQLAYAVSKIYQENPVHYIWVGGKGGGVNFSELELWHDMIHIGQAQCIHFLGEQPDPFRYFAAGDLFTLVSREDPFPLVCLEAASLGKPIICFDQAGGMPEFVEDDAGVVVPYLDLAAMAEVVAALLRNPERCWAAGQRARQKVWERHDINIMAPQIVQSIKHFGPPR